MKIHKEGRIIILYMLVICMITNYIALTYPNTLITFTGILAIVMLLFTIYFFRIPKRNRDTKDNIIYSPCDGKVVVIEETTENEYYQDKRIQVSIFMSPLNIHNNLYPISGIIKYKKYHPGKYLFAWNPKASTSNERSSIVIENNKISILCRQIAGALARRIITYSKLEENIKAGKELGFIKFGSRVDLFLPIGTNIIPKIGDKVYNEGWSIRSLKKNIE